MIKTLAASLILLTTTVSVHGQERGQRNDVPQLIRSTAPQPDDSALVRAARAAVAARQRSENRRVIDSSTLRRGRVYQSTGPVNVWFPPPLPPPEPYASRAAPSQQLVDAQKKLESLRAEQQRVAQEADEGPYGEMEEDQVEQRMSNLPREIDQAQRAVQEATPPQNQR